MVAVDVMAGGGPVVVAGAVVAGGLMAAGNVVVVDRPEAGGHDVDAVLVVLAAPALLAVVGHGPVAVPEPPRLGTVEEVVAGGCVVVVSGWVVVVGCVVVVVGCVVVVVGKPAPGRVGGETVVGVDEGVVAGEDVDELDVDELDVDDLDADEVEAEGPVVVPEEGAKSCWMAGEEPEPDALPEVEPLSAGAPARAAGTAPRAAAPTAPTRATPTTAVRLLARRPPRSAGRFSTHLGDGGTALPSGSPVGPPDPLVPPPGVWSAIAGED